MASATLTTLLIAVVLVGLAAGTIVGFMSVISNNYDVDTNNATSKVFSRINNDTINYVNATAKTLRDQSNDVGLLGKFTDILGAFFGGGYQALKQTMGAADMMNTLITISTDNLGLGSFKNALMAIIGIFIFLTVIIGALVKWERL